MSDGQARQSWRGTDFLLRHKRLAIALGLLIALIAGVRGYEEITHSSLVVRYSTLFSFPVDARTPWLAPEVRLALSRPAPVATPGAGPAWRSLMPGLDAGSLPAVVNGNEVDRVFLVRIDPTKYQFVVRNDPMNRTDLDEW